MSEASNNDAPATRPGIPLPVLPTADAAPAKLPPALSSFLADPERPMHRSPPDLTAAQRALEAKIVQVLRTIYDPEIPINIYDLGLIYEINIDDQSVVNVKMTLTAPACPVAGELPVQVESKIQNIPEVTSADVELVWDPPWDKSRLSESAQLDLGLM